MDTPLQATFAHVGVSAADPEALERFYVECFGFRRTKAFEIGTQRIVMLVLGRVGLEIFQSREARPGPPPDGAGPEYPSYRHLAFDVPDLDDALARLGKRVRPTLGPLVLEEIGPEFRVAWVADPEGNIIELTQARPAPPIFRETR